jgi:hypothetical protein
VLAFADVMHLLADELTGLGSGSPPPEPSRGKLSGKTDAGEVKMSGKMPARGLHRNPSAPPRAD